MSRPGSYLRGTSTAVRTPQKQYDDLLAWLLLSMLPCSEPVPQGPDLRKLIWETRAAGSIVSDTQEVAELLMSDKDERCPTTLLLNPQLLRIHQSGGPVGQDNNSC